MLTGSLPRLVRRLLAISRTIAFVALIPRESSLSIRLIRASSSSLLRFFNLGLQSRRDGRPARRCFSVVLGTLNALLAHFILSGIVD